MQCSLHIMSDVMCTNADEVLRAVGAGMVVGCMGGDFGCQIYSNTEE